ncbi:DUF5709 domain-containing protein [Spongisporangium articulatum]|uniref:DUF5709 domain-containing protein n=1 Tax=Spongisporangium articulatum TaxID=3362603 RepID=A0ABW8AP50_9ACTN
MSDAIYEPSDGDVENDVVDLDQAFGDDNVDDIYDTSYSPPDREPTNTKFGTTWAEESAGETLDQRIAQEEPDPTSRYETDEDVDAVNEDELEPEELRYSEVGSGRAGRLVDPDEGAHEDREKDLVGDDVGLDGGAASAEEAAVHVIDE